MQRKSKGSETIKVVFRVRPLNSKEKEEGRNITTIAHENQGLIEIRNPSREGGTESSKTFAFDAVFSEKSSQRHIYNVVAAPVVQSVLEGYNGTIFAYGQTGAGKTHTMEGVNGSYELRGIIPNTFEHIFDYITFNERNEKYLVRASYFEIYNEAIRDLLSPKPHNSLELKESDTGVYINDLTSTVVKSVEEIDKVFQIGKKQRSVGATLMNASSSRSHSVFTIVIECCSSADQGGYIRVGKLSLVDLAGSERQSKTGTTGERLKEASKINLSLSALGNVISALVDGKSQHIPYRDSKLTRILQDSLGGNTKTVMCANAGPADYNYDESLSTLRYANRAKNIKNRPLVNEDPKDAILREYQEEIAHLKQQLSQMSLSSSTPAIRSSFDEHDKLLIEDAQPNGSKQNETMRTKTTTEPGKLKAVQNEVQLAKDLAEEKQARIDTEHQRLLLRRQLDEMEAKLVGGGEFADNAKRQEAELRRTNQELALKKQQELTLSRRINEHEEEKLYLEEKYASLSDEVIAKTKKLKKILFKYQQAKTEIKDLEREFLVEKNDMIDDIRDLTKQLKLKEFIITSFIPPKYALLYDDVQNGGRAVYDEIREKWTIPDLKPNNFRTIRDRTRSTNGLSRPKSEFTECRRMVDPNIRWRSRDILDLDIIMPTRSTGYLDDPNTPERIAAILALDLSDQMGATNSRERKHKHRGKLFRVDDKQNTRERKEKSKRSFRPTTIT